MAPWCRPRGSPRAQIRVREPLRQAAHTVPMDATTGCANPPGGVGVERRRQMPPTRLPSLRFGGAPVSRAKIWGFSPRFRVSSRSGPTEGESVAFVGVASLPHHLGGWRTRWLGAKSYNYHYVITDIYPILKPTSPLFTWFYLKLNHQVFWDKPAFSV